MKLLLVSHGTFATGLLESYVMIAGENSDISAICLTDDGIGDFSKRLQDFVQMHLDEGLLILCDIKGGTPFNEAYREFLANPQQVKVVTGMNLPMLIETGVALQSGRKLEELFELAVNTGRTSVEGTEVLAQQEDEIDF